jgi:flagellar biosynthesis GTPase FlhF
MSDEQDAPQNSANPLTSFILENRSWMNPVSVLMIVYAVWAVLEVFSNTYLHGLQPLTIFETGTETNIDPDDLQRNNSSFIIASGAVVGLLGLFAQYVYRGAPAVDASIAATAAMILQQASGERMDEEGILAKAEEAAVAAAAEVAKETAEDTVIEMLDPNADVEDIEDEAEDEAEEAAADAEESESEPEAEESEPEAQDEAEEAAADAEESESEPEAEEAEPEAQDEAEEAETPPEEKKKF